MKRFKIKLISFLLALTMPFLICPTNVYAEETEKLNKDLTYEEYFENIHGFYSDTVTKSKQYLNMTTGLFNTLVKKESNGKITRNGEEVSGIIGNSEMVFFAMNNTVYRYHVKSKKIDKIFTEPTMESFYPISSHVILWKKATSRSNSLSKFFCCICVYCCFKIGIIFLSSAQSLSISLSIIMVSNSILPCGDC